MKPLTDPVARFEPMCNGLSRSMGGKCDPCGGQEVMLDDDKARGDTAFRKIGHEETGKKGSRTDGTLEARRAAQTGKKNA